MAKRKLYCECGGLIKLKSKTIQRKQSMYFRLDKYFIDDSKNVSIYKCSKCGKVSK